MQGERSLGGPRIPPRVRGVQVGSGKTRENVIVVTLPRVVKSTPGRGFIISIGGVFGGFFRGFLGVIGEL